MKTIIFVLELKETRGRGHWYRCLELSNQLKKKHKDIKIIWLIDYIDSFFIKHLKRKEIFFKVGNYGNPELVIEEVQRESAHLVVLDLMELQKEYVLEIKNNVKVITIGGSGLGLSYSNISINGMFKRKGFIEKFHGDDLYIGEQYIIFRSEIYNEYREKVISDTINKIFISLGADYEGRGLELAKIVKLQYPKVEINVLTCTEKRYRTIDGINVFKNINNPWVLFNTSDICITAGGMTAFEAAYLGIPLILIPITQIQKEASRKFADKGLGIYVEYNGCNSKIQLVNTLKIIEDKYIRKSIQGNQRKAFTGDLKQSAVEILSKEL